MNVKSQIVRDKILWKCSLAIARGRLYLPFAQLFDRVPKPNQNTDFFFSLLLQHQRTLHCGAIFHGRRNIVLKPSLLSRPLSPYWSSFLFPPPSIVLFAHLRPRVSFPQTVPPAKSVAAFILDPNDPNNNDGHLNFFNAIAPPRTNQNWAQYQIYNVSHFTEKKMNLCESSDDDSPQSKLYTVKSKGKKKRNKKSSEVWICFQSF